MIYFLKGCLFIKKGNKMGHWVIVDGVDDAGKVGVSKYGIVNC